MKIQFKELLFTLSIFAISSLGNAEIFTNLKSVTPIKNMSGNALDIGPFKFERIIEPDGVTIKFIKDDKVIKEFDGCPGNSLEETKKLNYVNIYKMLPTNDYQALIFISNCGAALQGSYEVINLKNDGSYQNVFDSEKYSTPGYFKIFKLTDDGYLEIFDCADEPFNGGSLIEFDSDKVDPYEIFSFNAARSEFLPANDKFQAEYKPYIKIEKQKIVKDDLKSVLSLCSYYWFMGDAAEGWRLFNEYYTAADNKDKSEQIRKVIDNNQYIKDLKLSNGINK